MSRVKLNPKEPGYEVVVGLDKPLSTFFVTVYGPEPEDPNADHRPLIFKDRWDRFDVIKIIDEYAIDDEETRRARKAIMLDLDPGE